MPDTDLHFTIDLARRTGELLRGYFQSDRLNARRKADYSVVTDADLAADRLIAQAIRAAYPNDTIISEELQSTLTHTSAGIWVVDPLDGTTNFSQGLQHWGVSIARLVDGQPQVAALYFPIIDELYSAQRGAGAARNGRPIETKPLEAHPSAFICFTSNVHRRFDVRLRMKSRVLGSAAYDLCAVASGIAAISFQAQPKLWDIAAGWLVVQEAGGTIIPYEGPGPFPPVHNADYAKQSFPIVAAATAELAEQAREQIVRK